MRKFVASALAVGLTLLALFSAQPRAADEPGEARTQDEQAIRRVSEAFARAFAGGDPEEYWRAKTAFLDEVWRSLA